MEFLVTLWLPILVATVALWFLSFFSWVFLPHHFGDFKKLDSENDLMELVKQSNIAPGNYMFPCANSKQEQGSKEFQELYARGPRGTLNVYNMPHMGSNMFQTILYFFVTALTIAYITNVACPPGVDETDFTKVFRVAGTIGVLTYASSGLLHRIWFKARKWTDMLDGAAYGVVLGLIFASLWQYAA